MQTTLKKLTTEVRIRLRSFVFSGDIPSDIIIDSRRTVHFDEEPVDDGTLGLRLLRSRTTGSGLQIHEMLDGEPYSYTDDPDEKAGGWLVLEYDTPHEIALQICADYDI